MGQRDVRDIAFGVVHVGLRDCVNAEPGGDTLFGIRPRPPLAQALALGGVTEPDGAGTAGPCKDTHHVNILEMNGDSYRLNQSRRRQTPTAN